MSHNKFKVLEVFDQKICTLEEVKNYLRIADNNDDILLDKLILAAIETAENFLGVTLIQRNIQFISTDNQMKKMFQLQYTPILKVQSFFLKKQEREINIPAYCYDLDETDGILVLQKPIQPQDTLVMRYISGLEENRISHSIKQGILMHVSEMYDREELSASGLSQEVKNLYLPFKRFRV